MRLVIKICKLKTAIRMIFQKKKHWVVIEMDNDEFIDLIAEKDFHATMSYYRHSDYTAWMAIHESAKAVSEIEMALKKAKFHAEAELLKNNR